jgi:hypothetical protein
MNLEFWIQDLDEFGILDTWMNLEFWIQDLDEFGILGTGPG